MMVFGMENFIIHIDGKIMENIMKEGSGLIL